MPGFGIDWKRGPYGEILPPPLNGGIEPDAILKEMLGGDTHGLMTARERALFYGDAAIYAHQKRLERVFGGETQTPVEAALYRAFIGGQPVSLRPLGYEHKIYQSFAPVVRRVGDGRWQVGVEEAGRVEIIEEADSRQAYLRARELATNLAEAESLGSK